jgi:DNA-binding HxlR family transcriptional regulator
MENQNNPICLCPLEGIIDIIGKKWALLIVNAIGNHGKLRFNHLMQQLGNISPKTLSDTLKELQQASIIQRESFNEIPPRVEYSLTKDGLELRTAIIPLLQWAAPRHKCSGCDSQTTSEAAHKIHLSTNCSQKSP